ncbi:signal peptidase I [Marinoscillum sp. MHG1-6]|uniref:signal peptidase I n=1 Tax=Marinoscillum sp. MHG1-6 TaxID=2959627 RepID=UPI00280BCE36|nr:signal peptidase I [Marinoscillum sp. MHG1-6]
MYLNDFSLTFCIIVLGGWYLMQGIAYHKFFEKANQPSWIGWVPFYNYYVHMKIIGRPVWWVALLFVPVVNFFIALTAHLDLMKSFGRYSYVDQSLGVIFAPFYMVYIAFADTKYEGKATELPKRKRTIVQEWFEAIVFAVFAATFIRWIFMEAYVIPTPSMEKSLLVGDFLFVSKINYGPRTPKTPFQIPLTHATIWGSDAPSYSDAIQLPQFRLPSLGKVDRGDVVVFNYPPEFKHPKDLRTHYIKRCVAVAGDTIEVKAGQVYINGKPQDNPELMQHDYFIKANKLVSDHNWMKIIEKYDLFQDLRPVKLQGGITSFYAMTNSEVARELEKLDFVESVKIQLRDTSIVEPEIFPDARYYPWNADYFGPLELPFRGMTIQADEYALAKYGSTIKNYEELDDVKIDIDKLFINGQEVAEYTFTKDYFFMMGDNRHNSADSRYWGFVPEDFVVGEASFIWMSMDDRNSFPANIRWKRLFKPIE